MQVGKNRTFLKKLRRKNLEKEKIMIDKIKTLPEKFAFGIGLILILGVDLFLFLFSFGIWTTMIVRGIVVCVAILFVLSAADKRHSRIDKKK
jgi:hypothetical protein